MPDIMVGRCGHAEIRTIESTVAMESFRMLMRTSLKLMLLLPLLLMKLGCDRTTVQTMEAVTAANGTDRLIRNVWETVSSLRPDEKSHDSHSLVWQRLEGGLWIDHVTITQDDFQHGNPHRRWVSSIHSFDPVSATAILQVAEGDAPESAPAISYIYSWREWDIRNNRQVKILRICDDPFEPYIPSVR